MKLGKCLKAVPPMMAFAILAALAATRTPAIPSDVHCPFHDYATCTWTGDTKFDSEGHQWDEFHCTCDDNVWVRDDDNETSARTTANSNKDAGHLSYVVTSASDGDVVVWVNTKTGVYHCPGDRWYGNTKQGFFTTQEKAVDAGDRPAYGKYCHQ